MLAYESAQQQSLITMKLDHIILKLMLASVLIMSLVVIFFYYHPTPHDNKTYKGIPSTAAPPQKTTLVYLCHMKGNSQVAEGVTRVLPTAQNGFALLKTSISQLLAGPTDGEKAKGFSSEIPPQVKLVAIEEFPERINIHLSSEFTLGGGSTSMQQRLAQLSKTIVSTQQTKPVFIMIDKKPLTILGGEGLEVHEPINEDPSVGHG